MLTLSVQLQDVVAEIQPDKMGFQIQQYIIITCVDCVGHIYILLEYANTLGLKSNINICKNVGLLCANE